MKYGLKFEMVNDELPEHLNRNMKCAEFSKFMKSEWEINCQSCYDREIQIQNVLSVRHGSGQQPAV